MEVAHLQLSLREPETIRKLPKQVSQVPSHPPLLDGTSQLIPTASQKALYGIYRGEKRRSRMNGWVSWYGRCKLKMDVCALQELWDHPETSVRRNSPVGQSSLWDLVSHFT